MMDAPEGVNLSPSSSLDDGVVLAFPDDTRFLYCSCVYFFGACTSRVLRKGTASAHISQLIPFPVTGSPVEEKIHRIRFLRFTDRDKITDFIVNPNINHASTSYVFHD